MVAIESIGYFRVPLRTGDISNFSIGELSFIDREGGGEGGQSTIYHPLGVGYLFLVGVLVHQLPGDFDVGFISREEKESYECSKFPSCVSCPSER